MGFKIPFPLHIQHLQQTEELFFKLLAGIRWSHYKQQLHWVKVGSFQKLQSYKLRAWEQAVQDFIKNTSRKKKKKNFKETISDEKDQSSKKDLHSSEC